MSRNRFSLVFLSLLVGCATSSMMTPRENTRAAI